MTEKSPNFAKTSEVFLENITKYRPALKAAKDAWKETEKAMEGVRKAYEHEYRNLPVQEEFLTKIEEDLDYAWKRKQVSKAQDLVIYLDAELSNIGHDSENLQKLKQLLEVS